MNDKLNKKLAAIIIMVSLATMPSPWEIIAGANSVYDYQMGVSCQDAANNWSLLFGTTAFGFGLTPGLQPFGMIYGGLALGARIYGAVMCV
jgi:hypothetical protein